MNSLKLNESKAPKKGCLGRLEGICADYKNPTRNGRLYPLALWKKVFDDTLVKEALKTRTLFGELDHPEDRFEPLLSEACVVMTDYRIDENEGVIYGGFDILDTPKGRILKTIVDGGSIVGVSSRGQGDIVESADGERVDEDSYEFACFDVVGTPAVERARQNVTESIKRINAKDFTDSVKHQISDAETVADLNIIRTVVRSSTLNSSEVDSLIESIEDKCKTLQSGETISESVVKSDDGEKTSTSMSESAKTIRDNRKLYRCIKDLKEKVSAYKHREARFVETVKEKEDQIQSLSKELKTLSKKQRAESVQHKRVAESFDRKLSKSDCTIEKYERLIESLRSENSKLSKQIKDKSIKYKTAIADKSDETATLQEKLNKSSERINYLESQIESISHEHESDIQSIDSEVENYSRLLTEAQNKIDDSQASIKELKESLSATQKSLQSSQGRNKQLVTELKRFQENYLKKVSKVSGIDPNSIKSSITSETTPQQIDALVEAMRDRIDRHNRIGITDSGIDLKSDYIVSSTNESTESEEDSRLLTFLNAAQGSL
jgi:predicted RNase H-like nuclease (RuvC/YqgF family)